MASAQVSEALSQVGNAEDPVAAFDKLFANLQSLSTPETISDDLKAIINSVFSGNSSLGIVAQRSIVDSFI